MKLKNMPKEELEILSYTAIAQLILEEEKKTFNTADLFKKICDLLEYSEEEFTSKIGDFYTALALDKRFVFLENNEWDLREKHPVEIILEDDDDEEEMESETDEDEMLEEETLEDIDAAIDDDDLDDDVDDDMEDLAVLSEEDLDEDN